MLQKILKYGAKALVKMIKGEKKFSGNEMYHEEFSKETSGGRNDLYTSIVHMIKKYESEKAVIKVSWEAGGDECPVYCTVNGSANYPDEDSKLFDEIAELIIQTLDLPDAGEAYNNGFADLYTKGDKLFMKTTYTYYGYDYSGSELGDIADKEPTLTLKLQLPDPYGWKSLLKRTELEIRGSLDNKGIFECSLWLNIRNGDDYEITQEHYDFYKGVLYKEIQKYKAEFPKSKFGLQLYKLSFAITLSGTLDILTELERQYVEIYEEAENQEIELRW